MTKSCFGEHPDRITPDCLICLDEYDCDVSTTKVDDYVCDCDPEGKRYKFKCPLCGGETISEELKAYSRVYTKLSGEFDPLDPLSYKLDFAEPLDDPINGANYWCESCGIIVLANSTRSDLRKWLIENNMDIRTLIEKNRL